MPSRDVTEFRKNGKSTLIVVEYKPLLPAFVTIDYCLLLAKKTVSITNSQTRTHSLFMCFGGERRLGVAPQPNPQSSLIPKTHK